MRDPLLVSSSEALHAALPLLRSAERLALDCESNGMHAWRGRLCVMQLAVAHADRPADDVVLIDTLAVTDLSPLAPLLGPKGPEKILHDSGFDARLLKDAGITLARVIDTSVLARFLGTRETGLASLLSSRFGLALEKSLQQHDWAKRPLEEREIAYLAGDVRDLGRLAATLQSEAAAADIEPEVREEAEYALRHALDVRDDVAPDGSTRPTYARVKGARELGAIGRSILREVCEVRERAAEAWDTPSGRVLSNASLVLVSKSRPRKGADVRAMGVLQGRAMELADAIADAVARGVTRGDIPPTERRWFAGERSGGDIGLRKAREALLSHWRTEEATRRGVDLQVVLPGHCLSDLASRGARSFAELRAIDGFGEVRVARYGAALVALLGTVS
ncbi:MAG: ribonuclease D [Polyangiales bacterium]